MALSGQLPGFRVRCADSGELRSILQELDGLPGVLTAFPHPAWDLYKVGAGAHRRAVVRFLDQFSPCIHAREMELF